MNLIGQTLLNQFRVESFIASGGMSAVYRVWDLQRSAPLAMKVLHAELADDPAFLRRFKREASALEDLAHPNIVPFYGMFQTEALTFLLERYIDGPPLRDILKQRAGTPLSFRDTLIFMKSISAALGYAHTRGIIHCDVKPGNILIDQGGHIVLTDFGIARFAESTTTTYAAIGTPAYMAPEQVRGEPVSPQTDIYSLGALLYHLLTGQRPYSADDGTRPGKEINQLERVRQAHLNMPPPDPRVLNPAVPPPLAQVVMTAMAKDPAARFQTAGSMAQAIFQATGTRSEEIPDRIDLRRLQEVSDDTQPNARPSPARTVPAATIPTAQPTFPLPQGPKPNASTPAAASAPRPASTVYPAAPERRLGRLKPGVLLAAALAALLCLGTVLGMNALRNRLPSSAPIQSRTNEAGSTLGAPAASTSASTGGTAAAPTPGTPSTGGTLPGELVVVMRKNGADRLVLINMETGATTDLPGPDKSEGAWAPQWSPDGNRLAWYGQIAGKPKIFILDMQSQQWLQAPAADGFSSLNAPAWLPDGSRFSFWAADSGRNWLVTADGQTGEQAQQVALPGYRNLFVWNWKTGQLAFTHRPGDIYEVSVSRAPDNIDLTIDSGGEEYAPAWSNDGEWLAFQSDSGREPGHNEIWISRPDGSDMRRISTTPEGSWSRGPSWSPDGHWIAYVSNQAGALAGDFGELFVVNVDTGETKQVTQTGGLIYDWRCAWRP